MNNSKVKGFTLIELLTVLAIMGVLMAVVVASTSASRAKARDTRRVSDMKEIQLGLALYNDVNKSYPAGTDVSVLSTLVTDKYLPSIPTDPAGGTYEYKSFNSNKTYCIGVKLEDPSGIPSDNVVNNSNCDTLTNSNYRSKPNN